VHPLAAAALAWTGAILAALSAATLDLPATFRLHGRGHVEARPLAPWDGELRADAVITKGERPGEVRLRLVGEGIACALVARLDAAGVLSVPPGQRCASPVRNAALDGRVEAVLASGSGRVVGEALELELAFTVSGAVRLQDGDLLGALLPGAGEPIPIRGEGRVRAAGRRDRSRAAE
jgi:hypothetical protein